MALPSPPPSATHFTTSGLYSPALTPLPSPMVRPAPLAETVASSGVQYATTAAPQVIPAVQQPPPQLGAPGAPGSRGRYPAPPPLHLHLQRPFPPPISPNVASFPLPPSPLVDHTPGSPLLPSPRMLYPGSHVLNYHQHASAPNHSVYATATSLPPSPPPIVPMEPRFC
ncbi:hypothetical protein BC828DRAFT_375954 [Blastocladiella britannica]|nr:hypothetical protein BC828DRAFT_375954 [Blastocladiella britannica]